MTNNRVTILREKLLADLRHQWTLQEMSNEVMLSASQLRKQFRMITGFSPIQFLRQARLNAARAFLETTLLNVKQIHFEVGINDPSHFSRSFKEMFGFAPSEYRTRFQSKSAEKNGQAEK